MLLSYTTLDGPQDFAEENGQRKNTVKNKQAVLYIDPKVTEPNHSQERTCITTEAVTKSDVCVFTKDCITYHAQREKLKMNAQTTKD